MKLYYGGGVLNEKNIETQGAASLYDWNLMMVLIRDLHSDHRKAV